LAKGHLEDFFSTPGERISTVYESHNLPGQPRSPPIEGPAKEFGAYDHI